jgi:hypothetical protein
MMPHEVTVWGSRRFVDAQSTIIGRLLAPKGASLVEQSEWSQDDHLVVYISWHDAQDLGAFVGGARRVLGRRGAWACRTVTPTRPPAATAVSASAVPGTSPRERRSRDTPATAGHDAGRCLALMIQLTLTFLGRVSLPPAEPVCASPDLQ